ncbi:MAG TPA: hypothetical protein VF552_12690 [Allosphingosinicella sp.]
MLFRLSAFSAVFALAACGQGSVANEIALNDADPALTAALEDPILSDQNLVSQANRNNVRPPELPTRAEYPRVPRASAEAPRSGPGAGAAPAASCGATRAGAPPQFSYGMEWAQRLPAAFPPYPGGRVTEAAGQDGGDCRVRVVTFRTADGFQRIVDWYRERAVSAGYSAEHQPRGRDHVLGGVNQGTRGAYYLIVTPVQGGSEVALIVNNGR